MASKLINCRCRVKKAGPTFLPLHPCTDHFLWGLFRLGTVGREAPPTHNETHFDWRTAVWYLHVPMIRALFNQLATPDKLGLLEAFWTWCRSSTEQPQP
jgi:hypothetical protein